MVLSLIITFATFAMFAAPGVLSARERIFGWCEQGNQTIAVLGYTSSAQTPVQRSYPSCTVKVFNAGTTTLSTIYADNSGTALANPFTADSKGYWFFYADVGHNDVNLSGGGLAASFTLADYTSLDPVTLAAGASGLVGFTQTGSSLLRDIQGKVKDYERTPQDFALCQNTPNVNIGDGGTHPLSDCFNNLTQAQTVYPFADSTTNELAWAGTQSAINSNRDVYVPTGSYLINKTLLWHWSAGRAFRGEKPPFLGTYQNAGAFFTWTGNSTDDFLLLQACRDMLFENFQLVPLAIHPLGTAIHVASDGATGHPTASGLRMESVYVRTPDTNSGSGTIIAENIFQNCLWFDNSPLDVGNDLNHTNDFKCWGYHSNGILISGGVQSIGNLFTKLELLADNNATRTNPNYSLNGDGISVGAQDNPVFPVGINAVQGQFHTVGGYYAKNAIDFMVHGSNGPASVIDNAISELGGTFYMIAQNPNNVASNVSIRDSSININHSTRYGVLNNYVIWFEQHGNLTVDNFSVQVQDFSQLPQIYLHQLSSNLWNYNFRGLRIQGAAVTLPDIFPGTLPSVLQNLTVQPANGVFNIYPTFFGESQTIHNCDNTSGDCSSNIAISKTLTGGQYLIGFGTNPYTQQASQAPAIFGWDSGSISGQQGAFWQTPGSANPLYIRSSGSNIAKFWGSDGQIHFYAPFDMSAGVVGGVRGAGVAPAVSGCSATIASASRNTAGSITSGTTGACTFTLTWSGGFAYTTGASCSFTNNTTAPTAFTNIIRQTGTTTTTVTGTGVTTFGDRITYVCNGWN